MPAAVPIDERCLGAQGVKLQPPEDTQEEACAAHLWLLWYRLLRAAEPDGRGRSAVPDGHRRGPPARAPADDVGDHMDYGANPDLYLDITREATERLRSRSPPDL